MDNSNMLKERNPQTCLSKGCYDGCHTIISFFIGDVVWSLIYLHRVPPRGGNREHSSLAEVALPHRHLED